jgi:succinate dehydrogenase flavin-adding protein (antitoxin of CptAB toxin-antitoxin module)
MQEQEESKQPDMKRVLVIGGALVLGIILIISQVTAKSIGERIESRILAGQLELDEILEQYSTQVSSIVLGSEPRPDSLVEMVRNYFVAPPEIGNDEDLFEWMNGRGMTMSDLRDEKIRQLLKTGRNAYQERRRSQRETEHAYHKTIGSLYSGFWLGINGYPTVAMENQSAP